MTADHSGVQLIERCRQAVRSWAVNGLGRSLAIACESLEDASRRSSSTKTRISAQEAFGRLTDCHSLLLRSFADSLKEAIDDELQKLGLSEFSVEIAPKAPDKDPTTTQWALIDHREISKWVEFERLVQEVEPIVAYQLSRLDTLISSVIEQSSVRPSLNPLRTRIVCKALMRTLGTYSESAEQLQIWLHHITNPFAKELSDMYQNVIDILKKEGVQQAQYKIKFSVVGLPLNQPHGKTHRQIPATNQPNGHTNTVAAFNAIAVLIDYAAFPISAPTTNKSPDESLELSDEELIKLRRAPSSVVSLDDEQPPLQEPWYPSRPTRTAAATRLKIRSESPHQTLLFTNWIEQPYTEKQQDSAGPASALSPLFYAQVNKMLERALNYHQLPFDEKAWEIEQARLRNMDIVERPVLDVTPQHHLPIKIWGYQIASPQVRERIALEIMIRATKMRQALSINAVRAFVARVARDTRLLRPMRQAVIAFEPALVRLALTEPGFLNSAKHPAMQFIEAITQRSFRYNEEFSADFEEFFEIVREIIHQLDMLDLPTSADVEQQLQVLQDTWRIQDQAYEKIKELVLEVLEFAQKRQHLANNIAKELAQRSDLANTPKDIEQFLLRDWSVVIAHAQFCDSRRELDPGGYVTIITDLLWSVKREETLRDLPRFFIILPRVVSTIRQGLELEGHTPAQMQVWFDMLMRYHQSPLTLRRVRSALDQGVPLNQINAGMTELSVQVQDASTQAISPNANNSNGNNNYNVSVGINTAPSTAPNPSSIHNPETFWLGWREKDTVGFIPESLLPMPKDTGTAANANRPIKDQKPMQTGTKSMPQTEENPQQLMSDSHIQTFFSTLKEGDWVDMYLYEQWQRAQLSWTSESGWLYMFFSQGRRPYTMTRWALQNLLFSQQIRTISNDSVVNRALSAIVVRK